ncbi:MAG TPA: hypothetical protein VKU77_24420 [Streptosporangiaceae bacterium]|nr:hypothetical protein [Streptosporangiaceae bacterium]
MQQPGGDQVAVEAVEGAADDGQFEVPGFRVEGLGVRCDRADVPGAQLVALAWTICAKSGSRSTAQTSAKDRRSGKASWPVPQARSSSRPCPETPARAIRSSVIASGYGSRQRS